MKSAFLLASLFISTVVSLNQALSQVESPSDLESFVAAFPEKYQGEYTLNPSETCRPVRKSTRVKIDMVSARSDQKIRVIYLDDGGKQVGSKLYPVRRGRIGAVNSKTNQPNSLLWETNVPARGEGSARAGTDSERMTFNEHALSFDTLQMRDPVGFFRFFKPDEKVGSTRCNFTRTEFMKAPAEESRGIQRSDQRRNTSP